MCPRELSQNGVQVGVSVFGNAVGAGVDQCWSFRVTGRDEEEEGTLEQWQLVVSILIT